MIKYKRLRKLSNHLKNGELGHKIFSFNHFNNLLDKTTEWFDKDGCGTLGCALGECPFIWSEWKFGVVHPDDDGVYPYSQSFIPVCGDSHYSFGSAMEWFEISSMMTQHLFNPKSQKPSLFGGEYLTGNASKEEVASNIDKFILRMRLYRFKKRSRLKRGVKKHVVISRYHPDTQKSTHRRGNKVPV